MKVKITQAELDRVLAVATRAARRTDSRVVVLWDRIALVSE